MSSTNGSAAQGPLSQRIQTKVMESLRPSHFEIINESQMHSRGEAESHFRLIIVSEKFNSQNRVDRSRAVYQTLAEELAGGVHALALVLHTPAEWQIRQTHVERESPACASSPPKTSKTENKIES